MARAGIHSYDPRDIASPMVIDSGARHFVAPRNDSSAPRQSRGIGLCLRKFTPRSFIMPLTRRAFAASSLALLAAPARAQQLDKVSFGTNWVAEAEHGGFYQALADGTYKKYGLDVTIVPGGPQV